MLLFTLTHDTHAMHNVMYKTQCNEQMNKFDVKLSSLNKVIQ